MTSLELPFLLAFGLVFRFLFILGPTTDQDYHLAHARWAKASGLRHLPVADSVMNAASGYPLLPHLVISFFPRRTWNFVGRLLNILYDLGSIALVYGFSASLFESPERRPALPAPFSAAGWATLLYSTSPVLFPVTARLKAMGGRTFGHLMTTAYFCVLGAAWRTEDPRLLGLGIPFGVGILIGSNFATQVLFFFSLVLGLFLWTPAPVVVLAAVFLVAWFCPFLGYRPVFRYTIALYRWYLRSIDKNSPIADRNRLLDHLRLPVTFFRKPALFLRTLFENSSWFIGAYGLPTLVILIAGCAADPGFSLPPSRSADRFC